MKTYVWVTFAFMGWGYYEMSGGNDFVPEQRPVLAEVSAEPVAEIVTRASTPSLLSVSSSNIAPPQPAPEAVIIQAAATPAAPTEVVIEEDTPIVEVVAPVAQAPIDIRSVAGSRVNMRMGPSTGFDVITTLDGGTEAEVLEVTADGWARVRTVENGIEGWMAERLLSAPQG